MRIADERGFTLVEVLVAASVMLVVLSATLSLLSAGTRHQRLVVAHNEAQQQARTSLDSISRDLRNLASGADLSESQVLFGGATLPRSVERNLAYDLIFRTIDDTRAPGSANATNVKRVRYCLDSTNPASGSIWQQTQTWSTAVEPPGPAATACPGTGWDAARNRIVAASVTNRAGGRNRPLFRYSGPSGSVTATDEAARKTITRLRSDLYVDPDPLRTPRESHLATAVFLRNQNREPVASFTITPIGGSRTIELNGTASEDPEGHPLREYQSYVDPPTPLPVCNGATPHASCVGIGAPRVQFAVPDTLRHVYVLKVADPAGLVSTAREEYVLP